MKEKTNQFDSDESNYFRIIKNNITTLDLFIISKMNEGFSIDEVAKAAEKEFEIQHPKKIIEERFKRLISEEKPEERIILQSIPQYVTNPTKLYTNLLFIFIKANLDSADRTNLEISMENVFDTIINLNNKPHFGKPIKQLFTTPGWMFDYVGIAYVNNIRLFLSFRDHLINEGIVKTVDVVPISMDGGFLFNPLAIPDYHNFKQFLIHYNNRMNAMVNELKTSDVTSMKTMRFFKKDEYGLSSIRGKTKGEVYPMDKTELKIGRYHDNDIILQDIAVSRRHAKIVKIGNQYLFKDQSTNGSYVNGKLLFNSEIELKDNDVITIGKNEFKFQKVCIEEK